MIAKARYCKFFYLIKHCKNTFVSNDVTYETYIFFTVPPKIKTPLNDIRIKAGQIFHVDIDFIGEPPPEVIWSVETKPLKTDERTTVTSIGYHTIVHTVNAKRTDSGLYHLMLRNSSGLDEGSFQVIVLGKNLKLYSYNVQKRSEMKDILKYYNKVLMVKM